MAKRNDFMNVNGEGNRLKEYRIKIGVTQKQMAEGYMSKSHFQALENNRKRLTFKKAIVLADKINTIASQKGLEINVEASELMGNK